MPWLPILGVLGASVAGWLGYSLAGDDAPDVVIQGGTVQTPGAGEAVAWWITVGAAIAVGAAVAVSWAWGRR